MAQAVERRRIEMQNPFVHLQYNDSQAREDSFQQQVTFNQEETFLEVERLQEANR